MHAHVCVNVVANGQAWFRTSYTYVSVGVWVVVCCACTVVLRMISSSSMGPHHVHLIWMTWHSQGRVQNNVCSPPKLSIRVDSPSHKGSPAKSSPSQKGSPAKQEGPTVFAKTQKGSVFAAQAGTGVLGTFVRVCVR
eukprot:scaffold32723_cov22-Tisochrysis_lutea.AAC.2